VQKADVLDAVGKLIDVAEIFPMSSADLDLGNGARGHHDRLPHPVLIPANSVLRIAPTRSGSRRGLSNLKLAWPIKSNGAEKADPRSAKSPLQASEIADVFVEFCRIALPRIRAAAKTKKLRAS
jgi:hypothetical protein